MAKFTSLYREAVAFQSPGSPLAAHPGNRPTPHMSYPEGVASARCNPFGVRILFGPGTQGAPQAATLGFGIKRLRRKNAGSLPWLHATQKLQCTKPLGTQRKRRVPSGFEIPTSHATSITKHDTLSREPESSASCPSPSAHACTSPCDWT